MANVYLFNFLHMLKCVDTVLCGIRIVVLTRMRTVLQVGKRDVANVALQWSMALVFEKKKKNEPSIQEIKRPLAAKQMLLLLVRIARMPENMYGAFGLKSIPQIVRMLNGRSGKGCHYYCVVVKSAY